MLMDDDNSFGGYGDNGLPPITSTITISGNGASILRGPMERRNSAFFSSIATGTCT